jgi:hypothetical protein
MKPQEEEGSKLEETFPVSMEGGNQHLGAAPLLRARIAARGWSLDPGQYVVVDQGRCHLKSPAGAFEGLWTSRLCTRDKPLPMVGIDMCTGQAM